MFTFAVMFDGGFALVSTCREVKVVIDEHAEILIKSFFTREKAYVFACGEHVRRELERFPLVQPILPQFEDLKGSHIFCKQGVLSYPVVSRVFAAVHPTHMGIMTNTNSAVGFLELLARNSKIVEVNSIIVAKQVVNYEYLKYILPKSAYIQAPIPYADNIPTDTAIPVPYWNWMEQQGLIPPNLPFAENLLVSPIIKLRDRV